MTFILMMFKDQSLWVIYGTQYNLEVMTGACGANTTYYGKSMGKSMEKV